jgi:hypothetical protein
MSARVHRVVRPDSGVSSAVAAGSASVFPRFLGGAAADLAAAEKAAAAAVAAAQEEVARRGRVAVSVSRDLPSLDPAAVDSLLCSLSCLGIDGGSDLDLAVSAVAAALESAGSVPAPAAPLVAAVEDGFCQELGLSAMPPVQDVAWVADLRVAVTCLAETLVSAGCGSAVLSLSPGGAAYGHLLDVVSLVVRVALAVQAVGGLES